MISSQLNYIKKYEKYLKSEQNIREHNKDSFNQLLQQAWLFVLFWISSFREIETKTKQCIMVYKLCIIMHIYRQFYNLWIPGVNYDLFWDSGLRFSNASEEEDKMAFAPLEK